MGKHILVVEDDKVSRFSLEENLLGAGYEVRTASDGDKAISIVNKVKFDLAIVDIGLPGANGFDVLRFIKSKDPSMKVIVLTGHGDLRSAIIARRLGADYFVTKPFDFEDLSSNIERILGG